MYRQATEILQHNCADNLAGMRIQLPLSVLDTGTRVPGTIVPDVQIVPAAASQTYQYKCILFIVIVCHTGTLVWHTKCPGNKPRK